MAVLACMRCAAGVNAPDELVDAAIEVLCGDCKTRRAAAEIARRRAQIGVPPPLAAYTFESIDQPEGIERGIDLARKWAAGDLDRVGFVGPPGTGKTRVAVAAANELVLHTPVRFYSAPELLARLGTGRIDAPARTLAMQALSGHVALVLDDLDKARPTEYAAEQLFLAIDARIDGAAPLLVTTNLSSEELAVRWPQPYGEAITSRLLLCEWAHFGGPDRRARSTDA